MDCKSLRNLLKPESHDTIQTFSRKLALANRWQEKAKSERRVLWLPRLPTPFPPCPAQDRGILQGTGGLQPQHLQLYRRIPA